MAFPEKNNRLKPSSSSVSRRQFLKRLGVLGGGLLVCFSVGDPLALARAKREGFLGANIPSDFNAFLRITPDGRVTCFTGKIEMGQGVVTSLPQMLADELDVLYDDVEIIMGDTDLCPWDAGTFGSLSTRHFGVFLREAASEAKGVLKELAAFHLMCKISDLKTENGVVFDQKNPVNRVTYGQLTRGKTIERHLTDVPPLKPVTEFRVMGRSFPRRDAYEKVTGQAKFSGDLRLPGMLYAKILRPPAHGAELKSVDLSEAEKISGVGIIREGELVAVLHELPDVAQQALAKIKAQYTESQNQLDDENIFDHFLATPTEPEIAAQGGSLAQGEKLSAVLLEETYLNSYVAHAPMEPHAALAHFENGRMTVTASTQGPFTAQVQVAEAIGLPPDKVRIVTPYVGGGFGGKNANQQAVEAARLAKLTGRPVQVAWTRAEEFFYDTFRPAAVVKIKSGLNRDGKLVLWDYKVYQAGQRGCEIFYQVPNHTETVYGGWMGHGSHRKDHPFSVGPWRAPANNTNTYARELHLNLLASKAGRDPLEFRLEHLSDPRMIGVLKAAAEKFHWTPANTPSGRGVGLACGIDAGAYVAAMAEVEVDKATGGVSVIRLVCAQDMGQVVNPQGAILQMEGCVTMGLGYALGEEIHFKNGRILDLNFDTYEIPRFSWLPRIETIIVPNNDLAPQGGGEPAIIIMGGVIANAIHDATGVIPRQLPITPKRLLAALKK